MSAIRGFDPQGTSGALERLQEIRVSDALLQGHLEVLRADAFRGLRKAPRSEWLGEASNPRVPTLGPH